nr:uncharacterized protein LOC117277926 [Nicotiana tomentosiformis]
MEDWYNQGRYKLTSNIEYSITQSYLSLIVQYNKLEVATLVWTALAQPKNRFIMWLAVQRRLLTKERMLKLHIQLEDSSCYLCNCQVLETNEHLFKEYDWSKLVWQVVLQWIGITVQVADAKIMLESIKKKHWKVFKKELEAAICATVIYHTWRVRNWKLFREVNVHSSEVIIIIKREIKERVEMLRASKKAQKCRRLVQDI